MAMWDAVEVAQFRRLQGLKLEGLRPINVLVGPNNCGKTSVLEALAILCNPLDSANWAMVARNREERGLPMQLGERIKLLFPQTEQPSSTHEQFLFYGQIELHLSAGGTTVPVNAALSELRVENNPAKPQESEESEVSRDSEPVIGMFLSVNRANEPTFSQHFLSNQTFIRLPAGAPPLSPFKLITPATHRNEYGLVRAISQVVEGSGKPELIRLLKLFDPRIDNLEIVSPSGKFPLVKLWRSGVGYLPVSGEGDGVRRALTLAAAAYAATDGLLLLDEMETAFHVGVLAEVIEFLLQTCRNQRIQVFATTHSLEALDVVVAAARDCLDDLAVFRLPPVGSSVPVKRLTGAEVSRMRAEHGFDLR